MSSPSPQTVMPAKRLSQPFGHLGMAVQPAREQLELPCLDLPLLNALQKVLEEGGRNVLAPDARHCDSDAVEAAGQSFP